MRLLIKNGILVDPSQKMKGKYDILIEDGKIRDIRNFSMERDCQSIDAEGMYVVPGLLDMHVHLRDPGYTEKETIETGMHAAAAGGFTSIVCMANTNPAIDNKETIEYIKTKAKNGPVNVYMMGSITKNLEGQVINEYALLKEAGVVGISDDGMTIMNARIMYEALKEAKEHNLLASVHCEDKNLVYDNSIHCGETASQLDLQGRPSISEEVIVARDILLAESLNAKIHIQHVSSKESVQLIRRAKERGVLVSCEAAPHHFLLTEEAVKHYGTNAKMSPPLRRDEDLKEIIAGLKDGTIDVIASDHAPHTKADKDKNILEAANGIVGLETSLGLVLTYLFHEKQIDITQLIELMSLRPAELLGMNKGTLKVDKEADITIIDPNKNWVVDKNQFLSKGQNTPFNGMKLKGKAVMTIVKGKIEYKDI